MFRLDPEYEESEEKYKALKKEILDESSDESGSGSSSGSEEDSDDEEGIIKDFGIINLLTDIYEISMK